MPRSFRLVPGLALLGILVSGVVASAATVALDYPHALIGGFNAEPALFRYRVSNTNFDHSIANGGVIPPATWVGTRNLGNHNALNGAVWDFTLDYVAGVGYTFTLTHVGGGSPSTTSSVLSYTSVAPPASFNAIEIYAQLRNVSNYATGSIDVTDFAFSGAGLTLDPVYNTLRDLHDDHLSLPGPGGNDLDLQWIRADVDLSLYSWTLTGRVVASFTGYTGGNLDERIKFNIKTADVTPPVVPVEATRWGQLKVLRP